MMVVDQTWSFTVMEVRRLLEPWLWLIFRRLWECKVSQKVVIASSRVGNARSGL